MSSRLSNILFLTGGRALASIMSLGSLMVLSRLLVKEDYGIYQQVWMVYLTLLPFLMLGLPSSITYFAPQMDHAGQKRLVIQTALMLGVAGLIIGLINFFGAPWLASGLGGEKQTPLFRAFFWFPISSLPILCLDTWLLANGRAKLAGGFNIISETLNFIAVVGPVYLGANIQTVFYSLSGVSLLRLTVLGVFLFLFYRKVSFSWDLILVKRQLVYTLPLAAATMVGTLTLQLDRWIVAFFFDTNTYAMYVNGARELPFVGMVAGSVMAVITPEFVKLYKENNTTEIIKLWHSATKKVAMIFLPLAAFLMVYGQDAMVLLFSKRYMDSALVFRLYLLLFPLRITVFGSVLMASGATKRIMHAAIGVLVLDVVLNFILTPWLGLIGPICATLVSAYVMALLQLYWSAKLLQVGFRAIFPWRDLFVLFVFSCLAAVVTILILPMVSGLFSKGLVGVVVFGLVACLCATVLPEMKVMLFRFIPYRLKT